ncbi:hypothetical protein C2845_PM01G23350 [Panicum miliaceum]|uniref:Protein argonaute MEL1-like n=1 Tax=Panicum miliaceum TaxID=4540 RepID=A0A3L6TSH8_PANMI|nr:hypothetical protein C2845_PM01G23350 [Panicum miliaceum]
MAARAGRGAAGSYPLAVSVKARRGWWRQAGGGSRAASFLHRDGPTGTAPRAGGDGGRCLLPQQATTSRQRDGARQPAQRPRLARPHDGCLAGRVDTAAGHAGDAYETEAPGRPEALEAADARSFRATYERERQGHRAGRDQLAEGWPVTTQHAESFRQAATMAGDAHGTTTTTHVAAEASRGSQPPRAFARSRDRLRAGGGRGSPGFVWPPQPSTARPVPVQYQVPMGYRAPMVLPHQAAYGAPEAVYRAPAPAGPPVSFSSAPRAVAVTIWAPPPSASAAPAPAPAPAPRQLAQGAPTRASEPAPASSAPSAAVLAKEVEKKLFVSETALAPPAAAAAAAVAAAHGAAASDAEDAPDVDLAPVSKKGLAHPARPGVGTVGKSVRIRANHFLVDVADNHLFHYDVAINPESKSRGTNREVLNELIKLHGKTLLGGKLPAYDGRKSLYTAGPDQKIQDNWGYFHAYEPADVCKIVEGQRYSKKLNDRQVTNILRATCKRPQEREQSIRDMVLHNNYVEDKFAQEFGIKVCNDLVSVEARVLPPPLLKYHDSGREKTCSPSVGQWNMINKKMINGGTIDNWTCLNFSRMRPEEVQRFCMDLTHMCNATGMNVNPRPFVEVKSAAPNHIENALRDVHRRATQMVAQQGMGNQLQLLVVILPEVSGSYVPPAYYAHLAAFRARYYVEGESSDGGSTPGSRGQAVAREGPVEVRQLPKIKDSVKDVMFYC